METGTVDLSAIDSTVDTGVDDSVSYDTTTDDGGASSADGSGEGASEHQDGSQGAAEGADGRKGPAGVRNSLKAASEAAPEHAAAFKELGAAYFREQAFRQAFPTVQDAVSAKNLIESIGGVDGVAALQQRDAKYQANDAALLAGDPAVLDGFAKDAPEGFAALAPAYLEKLSTLNPQALQAAVAPYAVSMLANAGFADALKGIYNETDPAKAKQLVANMFNWFATQSQAAGQMTQKPAKNPAADKIQQQQTELNTQREELFKSNVNTKLFATLRPQFEKTITTMAAKNKWTPEQTAEFKQRLVADIDKKMSADKTYMGQVNIRMQNKQRTHDTVASYMSGEYLRVLNSKDGAMATEAAFNRLIGKGTRTVATAKPGEGVQKAGGPKTAPGGGPLQIATRPSDDQIDHQQTSTVDLISGRAYLKGSGKYVSWMRY